MTKAIAKKRGRPPAIIDLGRVQELASKGVNQKQAATALGISARTVRNKMEDDPAFQAAHERGLTEWREFLATEIKKRIESGKGSDLLVIAAANQTQGLGWEKPGSQVKVEGHLDVVVREEIITDPVLVQAERVDDEQV